MYTTNTGERKLVPVRGRTRAPLMAVTDTEIERRGVVRERDGRDAAFSSRKQQ
jgi:hypothetical protein